MIASHNDIKHAAHAIRQGKLVAFPTETVYGLGANALMDDAVAAIYAAKGRPQFNPLIVHVASLEQAAQFAEFNGHARALAKAFWPGPLTLVLPRKKDCALSLLVSAGMDTVALRMPAHPMAQDLLHQAGVPIAAPSANRSGRISPTDAAHVREELSGRVSIILDGGPCHIGLESTVVDATRDSVLILRPGSITPAQLRQIITDCRAATQHHPISAPGMLASHYAPSKAMRLNVSQPGPDEALLAFGPFVPPGAAYTENLSHSANLQEAAANLFRMLRMLDMTQARAIAVMRIPEDEDACALGIAINDRLRRAATPPSPQ